MTDFVLSGLVKRRAELAGEADAIKARLAQIAADLGHLDAVIRLFDPEFDLDAVRPKRVRAGEAPAGRGEMSRAVLGVLRGATEPMTTAAVAAEVAAARGLDGQDRRAAARMMIASAWRCGGRSGTG